MRRPPPKKANPIEPLLCNHCDHRGLRYQGSRRRASGEYKVYKCVSCGRTSQRPGGEVKSPPKVKPAAVEMCPRHSVPVDFMARAFKIQTMPWRVEL